MPPMRRRARHLFTLCSAVSLVLCVAACVLWARNGATMHGLRRGAVPEYGTAGSAGSLTVFTRAGALHWLYVGRSEHTPSGWKVLSGPQPPQFVTMTDRPTWQALGFGRGGGSGWWFVSVPFWCLIPLTIALPAAWLLVRLRRRRRARPGRCLVCGYDLRASLERGPECGAAAAGLPRADDGRWVAATGR